MVLNGLGSILHLRMDKWWLQEEGPNFFAVVAVLCVYSSKALLAMICVVSEPSRPFGIDQV